MSFLTDWHIRDNIIPGRLSLQAVSRVRAGRLILVLHGMTYQYQNIEKLTTDFPCINTDKLTASSALALPINRVSA